MSRPKGEAEDNVAAAQLDASVMRPATAAICLAASGSTAYTSTSLMAQEKGAVTIGISNNPDTALLSHADIPTCLRPLRSSQA